MKKIIIAASLLTGLATGLMASDDFNWLNISSKLQKEYKITPKAENTYNKNNEKMDEYLESRYGISPQRESAEQIYIESNQKKVSVGMYYVPGKIYKNGKPSGYDKLGIYINGKLNFSSIGYNISNLYGNVEIDRDKIDIGITKRIYLNYLLYKSKHYSKYYMKGFYAGAGLNIEMPTYDEYSSKNFIPGAIVELGYNSKKYNFFVNTKVPFIRLDNYGRKEATRRNITIGIGLRF